MKFTDEARRRVDPVWEAYHKHPFVKGIGDGNLDIEKFKYWLRQDYVYLQDYSRVFALGAAKANDLETMSTFANLLNGTLNIEMGLHRKYTAKFGITEEELEKEAPSPTTQAYTDFLITSCYSGDLAELSAALLPCTWGFNEIGLRLREVGDTSKNNPYADWIQMYSSKEFGEFKDWTCSLMNRVAEGCSREKIERLMGIFITSSKYEYLFWEMAEKMEKWPI